mmetsp:Transcript_6419/g.10196  ORF Transcript_6419/g.10196 Transcript_6419/m.10196 type:complete len:266 (+) Transcript_6419:1714-2511(+)
MGRLATTPQGRARPPPEETGRGVLSTRVPHGQTSRLPAQESTRWPITTPSRSTTAAPTQRLSPCHPTMRTRRCLFIHRLRMPNHYHALRTRRATGPAPIGRQPTMHQILGLPPTKAPQPSPWPLPLTHFRPLRPPYAHLAGALSRLSSRRQRKPRTLSLPTLWICAQTAGACGMTGSPSWPAHLPIGASIWSPSHPGFQQPTPCTGPSTSRPTPRNSSFSWSLNLARRSNSTCSTGPETKTQLCTPLCRRRCLQETTQKQPAGVG